jgi:broad specificity phosphatase PhoE
MTPRNAASVAEHSGLTLELAQKESAEHMKGMEEVYQALRSRPMTIKAYSLDDPQAPETCKTVHFVRHGQGFHNLLADLARAWAGADWEPYARTPENPYLRPELLDAPLTEQGRQQALQLQGAVRALVHPPELVVCSPHCRALQTGALAFASLMGTSSSGSAGAVPFVAHEMVREETGVHLCDKRRPVSQQRAEFPHVDFALLEESEDDPLFRDDQRESKLAVAQRIYAFLEWLDRRPEKHVAVNSHSGWLLTLFNAVVSDECDPKLKVWFQTGEMRSVKLECLLKS